VPTKCTVLVVDDEPYILPTLVALLSPEFRVLTAGSADAAEALFATHAIDLILTDQRMPGRTGVELLQWVRQHSPRTVRLLMTGYAELDDAIDAINRAHIYHYLMKPWRTEELLLTLRNAAERFVLEQSRDQLMGELRDLNLDLEQRVTERTRDLERANRELQTQAEELRRLALTDPLTGLFNRRAMDGLALAELKRHARYQNPLAMGLIDIDHFGRVNAEHLHPGGDAVLVELAKVLTGTVREVVDSVGRIGGEEFLVIARETSWDGAVGLAERIRAAVADTAIPYKGHVIRITASAGFAVAEGGFETDFVSMYGLAAAALSTAKKTGRNRCVIRRLEAPDPAEVH